MSPPDWSTIERLFHEALELSPEDRARFREENAPAARVRAEVLALLEADADPGTLLSATPEEMAAAAGLVPAPLSGRMIGPYRILDVIGRGGMGTVYRAVREDLGNTVALKVVRGALGDPVRLARFRQEQRVLARLEHDGIARLLDAGVAGDETPYFVMEHVEGEPIDAWCDRQGLGVEARLRLFLDVCDAVAFAHRNLVVHRDVKPSNVLVTREGRVKLLDFGIAKLLEDTDGDPTLTTTGAHVLSPRYAAPEQVRGEAVGVATDVYGLGLVLYELLTGCHAQPVEEGDPFAAAAAVLRAEVRPPSAAVRRRRTERAAGPPGDAGKLARRLAGDLDAICLRALEKDPARRYATVESLRDDIARHLEGRPVSARPPTRAYRVGKFVRRNALAVTAAAVLALSLAGGVGAVAWQAERTERARAAAEELADFLVELFEASDPNETVGQAVSARDLLERGRIRADRLGDRPEVQAGILGAMARAYLGLGDSERADSLARRVLEQERALHGGRHVDVANALVTMAQIRREQGREAEAASLLREALKLRRDLLGDRHDLTTEAMLELAAVIQQSGSYSEAESLTREALAARIARHGPDHELVAEGIAALALIVWNAGGDLHQSETLFREALAMGERLWGPEDPRLEGTLIALSALLPLVDKADEAEVLARRALEMWRRIYGDDHPQTIHQYSNVARALDAQGRRAEARTLYREMLQRYEGIFRGDHPMIATAINNLSATFYAEGRLDSAEHYLRQALEMRIRLHGDPDANGALLYHNLGSRLRAQGRLAEAERALAEAYRQRIELYGADNPVALRTGSAYGDVLVQLGKLEEAESLLRGILERQRDESGDISSDAARTMGYLAGILARRGAYEEAEALYLPALEVARSRMPPTHPRRRELVNGLARLYEAWGRPADAERVRREAEGGD